MTDREHLGIVTPPASQSQGEGGEYTIFKELTVQELVAEFENDQYPTSARVLVAIRTVSAVGREQAVDAHVAELDDAGKKWQGNRYVPILPRYTKPIVRTGKQTRYS